MPKFNAQERSLIQTIVATLSIKRLSDAEIIQEISDKTNKTVTKQTLCNIRNRIKKESAKWYSQLRQSEYEYILYALYLIKQLAANNNTSKKILDAKIILPNEIFPLPAVDQSLAEHREKEYARRRKIVEDNKIKLVKAAKTLHDNRRTVDEIMDNFEMADPDRHFTKSNKNLRKQGFFLAKEAVQKMSDESKRVLKEHGFVDGDIDVPKSVITIEKTNVATARNLYQNMHQGTIMVKVGSSLLPDHSIYQILWIQIQTAH